MGVLDPITTAGTTRNASVVLDANQDNRPDLAYLTASGFSVTLNSAQPGIAFSAPFNYATSNTVALAAADFNNDSRTDLAILKSDALEIWGNVLSSGAPSFTLQRTIPISGSFTLIQAADLNKDSLPDIAITSPGTTRFFRNTSTGGTHLFVDEGPFSDPNGRPTGGTALVLTDRTGDGFPEVILSQPGIFVIHRNTSSQAGAISFQSSGLGSDGSWQNNRFTLAVDVTRDGNPDLIGIDGNLVRVLGGSIAAFAINAGAVLTHPSLLLDVEVADFNGDSLPDIAALSGDAVRIWTNTTPAPGLNFTGQMATIPLAGGSEFAAANFSSDARPDLVVTGFPFAQLIPVLNGHLPLLVVASPNPVTASTPFQLIADASLQGCSASGSVTFTRGATRLGTQPLVDGRATIVTSLSAGIQQISAVFTPNSPDQPFTGGSGRAVVFVDSTSCSTQVAQAQVQPGGIRFDRVANQFVQTVTIRNTTASPLTGPISLAFEGLPANVAVVGASPASGCGVPAGTPFVNLNVCTGGTLAPNASITTTVRFSIAQNQPITYQPRVLAGFLAR
jgi:hypothetical protein